jgi:protein-disulfide isomerase
MQAPPDATLESLRALAEKLKLDWPRMERDIADPAIAAQLDANVSLARDLDVQGTPALVIGGSLVPGAIDLAQLKTAVGQARAAH